MAWGGTHTNTVATSDATGTYLTLTTTLDFDDATGDFDDAPGLFDGGFGTVQSIGTYEFLATSDDLGASFLAHYTATLDVEYKNTAIVFDGVAGLFDSRDGLFDGDDPEQNTVDVTLFVSQTDDDPAGSPTWSDWQEFTSGFTTARALKFKAVLETEDPGAMILVRELGVDVDLPYRTESASGEAITTTQAVVFDAAFYATPQISVTIDSGAAFTVTSKSATGFTVNTTGSTFFDWTAEGYGELIT